jgi:hypothetical protein
LSAASGFITAERDEYTQTFHDRYARNRGAEFSRELQTAAAKFR